MQTSWLSRIERWADEPGFRNQTLDHASSALHELLPGFPAPSDQPTEICVNGFRWFNGEMEAVADAIHRASRRPHSVTTTLQGAEWNVDRNAAGLWAVPGCSRLQTRDTRRNGWLPRTEPEASNRAVR
jgi:hypothetical protein